MDITAKMLRILLINDTPKKVGRLRAALIEAGFDVIDESGLIIDLPARVEAVRPDVILIDSDSPAAAMPCWSAL